MTIRAHHAGEMVGGNHLLEPFRFGRALLVALHAEFRGVGFLRQLFAGRVFGLRAVAGLTVHARVLARVFFLGDIGVAGFADFMSSVDNGQCGRFRDRISTVVAVLPEGRRNKERPENEKKDRPQYKDASQPEEMFGVFHAKQCGNPGSTGLEIGKTGT